MVKSNKLTAKCQSEPSPCPGNCTRWSGPRTRYTSVTRQPTPGLQPVRSWIDCHPVAPNRAVIGARGLSDSGLSKTTAQARRTRHGSPTRSIRDQ